MTSTLTTVPSIVHRHRTAFWLATAAVVGECLAGGAMDLAHLPPFFPILRHLGYPGYFADILGTAKLLAAAALLTPRAPRLTEWAYAGVVFTLLGAAASHLAVGDGPGAVVPPLCFAGLALVSRRLRPHPSATPG